MEADRKEVLVSIKDLRKSFPVQKGWLFRTVGRLNAVDGVSLEIEKGTTTALVGETGSGKTTLGRLVLRLLPADSGQVWFQGVEILSLPPSRLKNLRQDMQVIFQDPYGSLNPRMRVGEIVGEGLRIFRRGSRAEIAEKVKELLAKVGLPPSARELYPHEFSGGQRQRIGIARAIALRPAFIVCDEPVSSLDVSIQAQILNLLSDLQEEMGLTYLFIAHDLSVVEHIADRVAVMYRGRVVEEAVRDRLYRQPLHPYTRVLIESIPVPDPAARPPSSARPAPDSEDSEAGCSFYSRCPIRVDRCREEAPALREVEGGHRAACWEV